MLDEFLDEGDQRLRSPRLIGLFDDFMISDVYPSNTVLPVPPHVRSQVPYHLWLDSPEWSQVIHDLFKVINIVYILFAGEVVPLLEAWRWMPTVFPSVFAHGLSESGGAAVLVSQPVLVCFGHEHRDGVGISSLVGPFDFVLGVPWLSVQTREGYSADL